MNKLAIISTHPIQYNAPWFRLLAQNDSIRLKVFYTWSQAEKGVKYDPGFKKNISWDIPLLDGYDYSFIENTSTEPGTHHFRGIINPSLNNKIEQWQPDCILIFGWNFYSHLKCMRHFHKKIPILFRGDSTLIDEKPGVKKILRRFFLRWVFKHIDFALYVGEQNKKYFQVHGLKGDQLHYAPHAIDNNRFSDDKNIFLQRAKDWKREIGIGDDDFVILFAGKLEEKKNPFFLLQLSERLKDQKIKFLFVGNGELENVLKKGSQSDKRFFFLDFQNQQNMPVVYRLAEVFILPSKGPGETWGLAVNEAMACGKPVMVSDKAGCSIDLVQEGKNGIVFNINDVNKCCNFIEGLKNSKQTVGQMGNKSKSIVDCYSFDLIVASILYLVKKIMRAQ
ncbi:MAG: glycosyltransferase family 4 protein [Bacteroidetes bacterium]|nr:glycosyltransferase family 4 protein [Bacteroidota bacterium]